MRGGGLSLLMLISIRSWLVSAWLSPRCMPRYTPPASIRVRRKLGEKLGAAEKLYPDPNRWAILVVDAEYEKTLRKAG
jgi:hypothetical protein